MIRITFFLYFSKWILHGHSMISQLWQTEPVITRGKPQYTLSFTQYNKPDKWLWVLSTLNNAE